MNSALPVYIYVCICLEHIVIHSEQYTFVFG